MGRQRSSTKWIGRAALMGLGVLLVASGRAGAAPAGEGLDIGAEEAVRRPDHVQVRVVGHVAGASRDGRSFSVEAGEVTFDVAPAFATRFPALHPGDRVLVLGTLRSQTRLTAREVRVLGGSGDRPLTGAVREIDRRRSRIAVRSENGDLVQVEYTPATVFARLGRRVAAEQVRAGDALWVEGRWLGPRLVRATRVEVTGSGDRWERGQTGEIASVNRREHTLRVEFGEETHTVIVTDRTDIRRAGRALTFDDLLTGDAIRVSGEPRGEAVEARAIERLERGDAGRTVEGRVQGIDVEARILRISVNALIPITVRVYVPPDARITRGTRRLSLGDLREGDRVRARGPSREGRVAAESIEVLP